MRTGNAAIAWARGQVNDPVKNFEGLCLQFVRMSYDLPAVYPSAIAAWNAAKLKHPTTDANAIPRGAPVFWSIGRYGHVAVSLGGGLCLSTDVARLGRVDVVKIDTIRTKWGAQLLGWSEDVNGSTVVTRTPKAPKAPKDKPGGYNNVLRAREQLRVARRAVAIADRYLEAVPSERTIAKAVGSALDDLDTRIAGQVERLGKVKR